MNTTRCIRLPFRLGADPGGGWGAAPGTQGGAGGGGAAPGTQGGAGGGAPAAPAAFRTTGLEVPSRVTGPITAEALARVWCCAYSEYGGEAWRPAVEDAVRHFVELFQELSGQ